MKKKMLTALLAAVLCLALASCEDSDSSSEGKKTSSKDETSSVQESTPESEPASSAPDDSSGAPAPDDTSSGDESSKDDPDESLPPLGDMTYDTVTALTDGVFRIDGKEYKVPLHYSDLSSVFEFKYDTDTGDKPCNEDAVLPAWKEGEPYPATDGIVLGLKADGCDFPEELLIDLFNPTDKEVTYKNAPLTYLGIMNCDKYAAEPDKYKLVTIEFPGGMKLGMSRDEVKSLYGEPYDAESFNNMEAGKTYDFQFSNMDEDGNYAVLLYTMKDNKVVDISYQYNYGM